MDSLDSFISPQWIMKAGWSIEPPLRRINSVVRPMDTIESQKAFRFPALPEPNEQSLGCMESINQTQCWYREPPKKFQLPRPTTRALLTTNRITRDTRVAIFLITLTR